MELLELLDLQTSIFVGDNVHNANRLEDRVQPV